ncbi:MAG: thioredoxin fold domain-containing protein, partial [Betaproteobacteria bacterium]|nr:thioredoxin fold domain-containing protein [Betaproteobacteria bacterium]
LHPAAPEKAKAVWCSADRQKTWSALMLNNVAPSGAKSCENPVEKIAAFAQQKHINATPTMFLADGTRISGAKPAAELDRLMNEADARCAKEGKSLC